MAEGFAAIPTWMFREHDRVSLYGVMVYGALATRAGLRSNFPSQATLAIEARCSERKVRDALAELEALGVVERVRRASKLGHRMSDGYRLMDRPLLEGESLPAPDAARDGAYRHQATEPTGTSEQSIPYIEVDRSEVDITSDVVASDVHPDRAFAAFYLAYPRKVGKAAAFKAFTKAVKRAGSVGVVVGGARRLAADPNLPEKQFVPHPSTWLNRDGWEDEPLPARAGGRGSVLDVGRAADELLRDREDERGDGRGELSA